MSSSIFRKFPFHIAGIILFFILHGYNDYVGIIPVIDLLLYFVVAFAISLALLYVLKKRLLSYNKAGLIVTIILCFFLFYGVIQKQLLAIPVIGTIGRYRSLLVLMPLFIFAMYYVVKKTSHDLEKLTLYLNMLFLVLCIVDIGSISIKVISQTGTNQTDKEQNVLKQKTANSYAKPDIYFIIMDEYCGSRTLKNVFGYDNSWIESSLRSKGFFVASNPSSNYSVTALSMASMLNMDYLNWLHFEKKLEAKHYSVAEKQISKSTTLVYLESIGYKFYNYSVFDIDNQPSYFNTGLMPLRLKLITQKTLINMVEKDLLGTVHTKVTSRVSWLQEKYLESFRNGNRTLLQKTRETLESETTIPKFVYTHLMMPHWPVLYDSVGNKVNKNPLVIDGYSRDDHLQYLTYTNKVVLQLVTDILNKTKGNAVIILMSDHGIKRLGPENDLVLRNNNFNSVYLPSGDYHLFYDSISNVNQFRVLFNTLFKTGLPLLPDKHVF